MLPTSDLSSLPPPAQAAVDASRAAFIAKPQGRVRARSDVSHNNRASHFASLLSSVDVSQHLAGLLTPAVQLDLLVAYLAGVKAGFRLPSSKKMSDPLMPKTLYNYVTAAADYWSAVNPTPCSIYRDVHGGKNILHPYIRDHLATSSAWNQPKHVICSVRVFSGASQPRYHLFHSSRGSV
jgi:hypothetical protein